MARMQRLVVSPPSILPLSHRLHRHANGQLSSLCPPSPSACVNLFGFLPRSSQTFVSAVKVYDIYRRYKGRLALNMKTISSNVFADKVDILTPTFAV